MVKSFPDLMRIKPFLNSHVKISNKHFIAFGATKGYNKFQYCV